MSSQSAVSPGAASGQSRSAAVPVFLAFLVMGFGDAAGPFVGLARQQFHLSDFTAELITFTGFIMFGALSVPLGVFQDRKGKRYVLILGLLIMLAGVLIPTIFGLSVFAVFLLAVLLLGAGAAVLQVAGNPMMRDVSAEGKYSRNLSLAQFVKAIGSMSGPFIPVVALRAFGFSWRVVFPVFSAAIFIALVLALAMGRSPAPAPGRQNATIGSCLALLKNRYVAVMTLGIFLYVGAEVCLSSGIPLYLKDRFAVDIAKTGLLGSGLFFAALTAGRFMGGVVLNWIKPKLFLAITCAISILGLLGLFLPYEDVAVASFVVAGLGFANVFPLIFSIAIDHMPDHSNELSGLMVTAIVGAAFLPPFMGFVADIIHSVQFSFVVPLGAILYVTWLAIRNLRRASEAQMAS